MARPAMTRRRKALIFARIEEKTIPEPNSGCLIWLGANSPKGYGHLWFCDRFEKAHRAMYILCIGPIPKGMVVRHKCDNPYCVNPDHLVVGTTSDNVHDCINRGRARRGRFPGEANHHAILTRDDVSSIRATARYYGYRKDLARKFGVSESTIGKVMDGHTWRSSDAAL